MRQNYKATRDISDIIKKDQCVYADLSGTHFHFVTETITKKGKKEIIHEHDNHLHRIVVEDLVKSGTLIETDEVRIYK